MAGGRDDGFHYICDEEDLQYWLAGKAEVLLVMSRRSEKQACWVLTKSSAVERFCRDALAEHAKLFRLWHKFRDGRI